MPAIDTKLMIAPQPLSFIIGNNSLVTWIGAIEFKMIVLSQSSISPSGMVDCEPFPEILPCEIN
jgi:hypothetical protein